MAPAPPGSQVAPLPKNLPFQLVSKTIGQGAYASIRKATPPGKTNPVVAVKFINKEHAYRHGRLTPTTLRKEIALHRHLGKHPNIIHYIADGESEAWMWIVMELASGGDLFDKIEPDAGVGEDIAHFYFWQLVGAVGFMHQKGVAHRDLKPENVLLSSNGDLKLADFGLAALFEKDGKKRLCNTVCGSPPYIAPEVVRGRRSRSVNLLDEGYAAEICDIWSVGVVLFVLLVGNTPWDEPTMRSDEFKEFVDTKGNTTDPLWESLPPNMLDLLLGMLRLDPAERYTIRDIQSHPWYRRPNKYLSPSGRNAQPLEMATEMLSQLRIDFTKGPAMSQRLSQTPNASQATEADPYSQDHLTNDNPDAMDIDSTSPRRSRFSSHLTNDATITEDPITPYANQPFDWERPSQHLAFQHPPPTSQMSTDFSQLPNSTQEAISQDPAMSQFATNTTTGSQTLMTLTQAARDFKDILPPSTFSRFISPLSIGQLMPLVVDALLRLGIPATLPSEQEILRAERQNEASVRVKASGAAGRNGANGMGLNGHVVLERVVVGGVWTSEVRFVKASGDPLEWRRLFRNVVVCMGERVVVRPG